LTSIAGAIAAGDFDKKTNVTSNDELGTLAQAFDSMTGQLQSLFGSLEQRVADRTRNLELAAEVGRAVSQVRDLDTMLRDATELIRARFDLYYTQVYLTNPSQTELILQAGTGEVGEQLRRRGHRLSINTASINGRAVIEKRAVIISDTSASATFHPNPLLLETRSEMAVPLMIGDKVVGVLDMQSKNAGALNEETLSAFSAMAGQLAVAISNANLLAAAEEARTEVEAQAGRLTRANWKDYLDAINKAERVGFVYENNEIIPLVEDEIQLSSDGKTISSPIAISGEMLGSLVVEMNPDNQVAHSAELVNVVARQVAQQIENLRLLESAERYRLEAEGTTRRATIKGWKEYIEARGDASLGYLYDSNEVVPAGINDFKSNEKSITLPLKTREETIGKLAIMGVEEQDTESLGLATAVAERLSSHIENLRLFEETKRGQVELDKRARELESVAEISSVSARELDIHKMLETVVFLTQRRFGLYHAHVFTYNEFAKHLQIVACGWKEGDIHEGTHGTTTIALEQERSLVARAAREKRAVVVNDVQSDPGWLPNPLLPDTRSEMAVPLLVGDQLLGVLDVQKDYVNAFTDEDTAVVSTLATQVATALQNAHSFEQAQKQADRESMLNVISQKIQSATTVEAVLQIAARELGHALGAPLTIAQLGVKNGND
jgi:GAF domain-containing protein